MTVGKYCKSKNITLQVISNKTKQSRETLTNWYNNKRELFDIVLLGCLND